MKHNSIKMNTPCEFINITPCNPLISKCQIKVCYVGEDQNRNKSIITKEVAKQIANSLPGSPIVGYYNKETKDFEEHNRAFEVEDGKINIVDDTFPYGFVDMNAPVWFQWFEDDGVQHEYLMTEGYLWTGQYPESQRIIEKGNNQSMELDDQHIDAHWTKDQNGKPQFFIINKAVIKNLCILGEDYEPCFEGSQITKIEFSFGEDFENKMFAMMDELKDLLNKGGTQVFTNYSVKVGDSLWEVVYSYAEANNYNIEAILTDEEQNSFAVLKNEAGEVYKLGFSIAEDGSCSLAEEVSVMEVYEPAEEAQFSAEDIAAYKAAKEEEKNEKNEDEADKSDNENSDNNSEGEKSESEEEEKETEEEDEKKKKFSVTESEEYIELNSKYSELEEKYSALVQTNESLNNEINELKQFKLQTERVQKEDMINNTFYMLSEEDKKDVMENIDNYSLENIEEKLSVICFRKKVSYNPEEDEKLKSTTTYNLGNGDMYDDSTPAWVKAVLETSKTLQ